MNAPGKQRWAHRNVKNLLELMTDCSRRGEKKSRMHRNGTVRWRRWHQSGEVKKEDFGEMSRSKKEGEPRRKLHKNNMGKKDLKCGGRHKRE